MKVLIINGPNLNMLGKREKQIYGIVPFEEYFETLHQKVPEVELEYFQSNHEGDLIDRLHQSVEEDLDGVILNPGGYTHTSIALADAVACMNIPVIEVHISNIHEREEYRSRSLTGARSNGIICGFGLDGYQLAIHYLLSQKKQTV